MEGGAFEAKAVLPGRELSKVTSGLGYRTVEEFEDNTARRFSSNRYIELCRDIVNFSSNVS